MRISIDATGLGGPKTGTAVYLAEILAAWNRDHTIRHDFMVFSSPKATEHLSALNLDDRFQIVKAPDNRHLRGLWQQTVMAWHIYMSKADVHWGTAFVLPLLVGKPMVVTVHDLTFQLFPSVHEWIKRYYFPAMIKAAVNKARFVLAVSESTRDDLYTLLPNSLGKTFVTLLAARTFSSKAPEARASYQAAPHVDPYLLFVGTIEPRKNLERLIEAWYSIDSLDRHNTKLIIVGATGWMMDDMINRSVVDHLIEFKGFVDDDELARLMSGAIAFVYPSLYEGFGLPVLEAMAQGIPVLTSDRGATREMADSAAILIDPECVSSIRDGLIQLLKDDVLRSELSRRGVERAASFSWERTAQDTLALIEKAVL